MAQQKQAAGIWEFRPPTETALFSWCLKKLPKYNGKQIWVKGQQLLKYHIAFQLAPKCRNETEFHVTTEFWQATNKTYFGEAGIVSVVDFQQLQSEGNKKKNSVVRTRKGESHSSDVLRQMIWISVVVFLSLIFNKHLTEEHVKAAILGRRRQISCIVLISFM